MTIYDLFTVLAVVCGVALLLIVGHAVWAALYGDIKWFDDQMEEDEHAAGLTAPWNRRKR